MAKKRTTKPAGKQIKIGVKSPVSERTMLKTLLASQLAVCTCLNRLVTDDGDRELLAETFRLLTMALPSVLVTQDGQPVTPQPRRSNDGANQEH